MKIYPCKEPEIKTTLSFSEVIKEEGIYKAEIYKLVVIRNENDKDNTALALFYIRDNAKEVRAIDKEWGWWKSARYTKLDADLCLEVRERAKS